MVPACSRRQRRVECIPIDELTTRSRTTFIKMDIEGAELTRLRALAVDPDAPPDLSSAFTQARRSVAHPALHHALAEDYHLFLRLHEAMEKSWMLCRAGIGFG